MGNFEILAKRIKELRSKLKMTQKEFAVKVGCTPATLSAYENGSKSPSLEIVKGIAENCNTSIDWLCGLSDNLKESIKPESMSDVLKLLFLIDECTTITVNPRTVEVLDVSASGYPEPVDRENFEIGFDYYLYNTIIGEWDKMRSLYNSGTIDSEVYALWKEKTLNKWSSRLPSGEEPFIIPDEELPFDNDDELPFYSDSELPFNK